MPPEQFLNMEIARSRIESFNYSAHPEKNPAHIRVPTREASLVNFIVLLLA